MTRDQKIVKDERGQEQPADKFRAQKNSAAEGGAGYAPNNRDTTAPLARGNQQGLTGKDKRQNSLRDGKNDLTEEIPEGLRRERTHPLSPTQGRNE
jgi:hypothetical protein